MKTLQELTEEINQRTNILFKAVLFSNDSFYLSSPETPEERTLANIDVFIHKVRYSYWIISVLEMCKLYGGKNDDFTIKKLLNKLLTNYTNSEWKNIITKDKIQSWITELDEHEEIIISIKNLRDKFYAHTDRNFEKGIYETAPTIEKFKELVEFTKSILIEISKQVLDTHLLIDKPADGKADNILKTLLEIRNK